MNKMETLAIKQKEMKSKADYTVASGFPKQI